MGDRITPDKGKYENLFFVESHGEGEEAFLGEVMNDGGKRKILNLEVRERYEGQEDDLVFDIWEFHEYENKYLGEIDRDFPRNLFHKLKGYDVIYISDIGLMMADTVSYLLDYLSRTKTRKVVCVIGEETDVNVVTAQYVMWKCQEL